MAFWDHFDADEAAGLTEELGEPVVYVKNRDGVITRREVDAIVHRQPNRWDKGDAQGNNTMKVKPIRIVITNGGPRGISAEDLDTGLDGIELNRVANDPATICTLGIHMPSEKERTQNDERFQTFELY